MSKISKINYKSFLHNSLSNADSTDVELISVLIKKMEPLLSATMPFAPAVFAIDYQTHNFLFWKNNHNGFGGYASDFFKNEGHDGVVDIIIPNHYKTVSKLLFPKTLKALSHQSDSDIVISSFNYKGKKPNGKTFNAYQKCIYVLSEQTGLPLYYLGVAMDISHLKKDDFICHSLESLNTITHEIKVLSENTYNTNIEIYFTPKETLIIYYLLDGLSSKIIAEKLFISINTVNNHRQNILKKASCNNVAQLMAFVLKSKLS